MDKRPASAADSYSAVQENPRLLRSPKIRYRVHKSPPSVSMPSKVSPLGIQTHALQACKHSASTNYATARPLVLDGTEENHEKP
jgi:hypothetical protein